MTHGSDLGIWGATPPGSQPWLFPTYPERFPWFSLWVSDTKICHAPAKSQGLTCLKHLRFGFVFNCFTLFSGPPPLRPGLAGPTKPNWPAQHSHPTPRRTTRAAPRTLQPLNLAQLLLPFGVTCPLWLVSRDFPLLRQSWGRCPHEGPCPCRGWDLGLHQCWFPQPPYLLPDCHPGPTDTVRCQLPSWASELPLTYASGLGSQSCLRNRRGENMRKDVGLSLSPVTTDSGSYFLCCKNKDNNNTNLSCYWSN